MIPHETATETYKGYKIELLGGNLFEAGHGRPRGYGWLYEINFGSYTTEDARFPTKESALEAARAAIDRHTRSREAISPMTEEERARRRRMYAAAVDFLAALYPDRDRDEWEVYTLSELLLAVRSAARVAELSSEADKIAFGLPDGRHFQIGRGFRAWVCYTPYSVAVCHASVGSECVEIGGRKVVVPQFVLTFLDPGPFDLRDLFAPVVRYKIEADGKVRVYHNSGAKLLPETLTELSFDSERFDVPGMHDQLKVGDYVEVTPADRPLGVAPPQPLTQTWTCERGCGYDGNAADRATCEVCTRGRGD